MSEATVVQMAEIVDSRWQTRQAGYSGPEFKELVESVRQHGIVNPAGVFINENEQHEVVYGHRRLAAARKAGLSVVPVTVLGDLHQAHSQEDLNRFQQMVVADNLYHQDLSPLELAQALKALIEQQGLSQQAVAELYGKSQQWVSDKIRLLDLAPEVQEQFTARAVEESVARKLAALPVSYQEPAMKAIKHLPSRVAEGAIKDIAAAADPGFWDLPADGPWEPREMNIKTVIDDCLAQVPQEKMGEVLVQLQEHGHLRPVQRIGEYEIRAFRKICGLEAKTTADWLKEHGRTCETCVWKGHRGFYYCGREATETCSEHMGESDPVRLPIYEDELAEDCAQCRTDPGWCTDLACYLEHQAKVEEGEKAELDEEILARQIEAVEGLRRFYDRQLLPDVDQEHWLAQSCEFCLQFRGAEVREQCGHDDPAKVRTQFWTCGGVIVPRCSEFKLWDLQRLPEVNQAAMPAILLAWLERLQEPYYGGHIGWLCSDGKGAKWIQFLKAGGFSVKQLAAVVTLVLNEANNWIWEGARGKSVRIDPVTGEKSEWRLLVEKQIEPFPEAESESAEVVLGGPGTETEEKAEQPEIAG